MAFQTLISSKRGPLSKNGCVLQKNVANVIQYTHGYLKFVGFNSIMHPILIIILYFEQNMKNVVNFQNEIKIT